jgi:hypothetical protein
MCGYSSFSSLSSLCPLLGSPFILEAVMAFEGAPGAASWPRRRRLGRQECRAGGTAGTVRLMAKPPASVHLMLKGEHQDGSPCVGARMAVRLRSSLAVAAADVEAPGREEVLIVRKKTASARRPRRYVGLWKKVRFVCPSIIYGQINIGLSS